MKKKGERAVPAMATTSLPDVVYIVLFFFMLSTSMREQELYDDFHNRYHRVINRLAGGR